MFDSARLAAQLFSEKPPGVPYGSFRPDASKVQQVASECRNTALQSGFSSALSLADALTGIKQGLSSWPVVKLYYSAYYSIKCILVLNGVVPFNSGGEMLLDATTKRFIKGGSSSHVWKWSGLRSVDRLENDWFLSEDATETYDALRSERERANYTHEFPEPTVQISLATASDDVWRWFRTYRDDDDFFFTYLSDHRAVAYPVKLTFFVAQQLASNGLELSPDKASFLKRRWTGRDRCPLIV